MSLLDGPYATLNTRLSALSPGESVSLAVDPETKASLEDEIESKFDGQFITKYIPITEKNGQFRIEAC